MRTLEERQIDLEIEMAGLGQERFNTRLLKDLQSERGTATIPGQYLLKKSIQSLSTGITDYVNSVYNGKAGRASHAARLVKDMDHEVVAYLVARTVLNKTMRGTSTGCIPLLGMARKVATQLQHEARFLKFKEEAPGLYAKVNSQLSTDGASEQHRIQVLQYAMGKFDIEFDGWTLQERVSLGVRMVELLAEHTGYIEIIKGDKIGRHPDQYYTHLSKSLADWLDDAPARAEGLYPEHHPMIVPPVPWNDLQGGGYISRALPPVDFVRNNYHKLKKAQHKVLRGSYLGTVFNGVNAIQETAWRINDQVYKVQKHLSDIGSTICGFVPEDEQPLPPKPHDIDINPKALQEWKWAARDVYTANVKQRAKRLIQLMTLSAATRVKDEEKIYFPHSLDFRGRVYPVTDGIHPQGSDEVKALLEFAEGKPLGKTGKRWLAIHGANVWGEDKVSFDERVEWTEQHSQAILDCAQDPLQSLWWTEADKPWCFLAFCFEWAGAIFAGEDYISHLPIALDGSCNGLQHFSAMLRDSVGGEAVNLKPSDKPKDIYKTVADQAIKNLKWIAEGNEPDGEDKETRIRWAHEWLAFGLDRKITKRPVMVLPYGGTPRSCYTYVQEAVMERFEKGQEHNLGDELQKAIGFLSGIIWNSIGEVVVAARAAMTWLQQVARILSKEELPLVWTTPSGFMVRQAYPNEKKSQIRSQVAGKAVKFVSYVEQDSLDKSRQATSISPNYVHSMDAAALIMTVWVLHGMGLRSFAMIHDSYGVHACDTDLLATTLRQVFVDMYRIDPLEHLRDELVARYPQLKGKLPELPKKGNLNLEDIKQSDFFFA